jgi:hypothetical protein
MSFTAAGFDEGPPVGMLPPYHVRQLCDGSVSAGFAPLIWPWPFNQVYAPLAEPVEPWQCGQLPTVPLFKYVVHTCVHVGAEGPPDEELDELDDDEPLLDEPLLDEPLPDELLEEPLDDPLLVPLDDPPLDDPPLVAPEEPPWFVPPPPLDAVLPP